MDIINTLTTVEDKALTSVRDLQSTIVRYTKTVIGAVAPYATRVGEVDVDPAKAVVNNTFDFASQLLAANRTFAEELVAALEPLTKADAPVAKKAPTTKKVAA